MKNLHVLSLRFLGKIILSLFLLLPLSCKDPLEEGLTVGDPDFQGVEAWQDLLEDLSLEKSIIVQQEASIQEAIDAATPGDAIYIEAGLYKEVLTIDKANIKLIGIEGGTGEQVILENPGGKEKGIHVSKQIRGVEVRNITLQNFTDNTLPVFRNSPTQGAKQNTYFKMRREQLTGNIAHYEFEVRLGHREFDVVRIHRVVKEHRPYRPARTRGEVFMVHGASQGFEDIFLTADANGTINAQTASPFYLASKGVDVWGIDLAWTLVPLEISDFSFMQSWGVERDIDHTLAALSIARLVRGLTGQGFGQLNLLGFSYGAFVAYGAAGRETQQHRILRDIKGIIPVDQGLKYDLADVAFVTTACDAAAAAKALIDAGNYANTNGLFFSTIGQLAKNQPNAPYDQPPFNAFGLTNVQVTIFLGANTYFPGDSPAPFWHFAAGNQGMPFEIATGLAYTDLDRWVNLAAALPPYQPQQTGYEVRACLCDEEDVSFDDHLMEISLPIFYLGAGGGFGTLGQHTASLTASAAIETVVVSTQPERFKDFGHADLFVANDAAELAWEPLRQWLVNHHANYFP